MIQPVSMIVLADMGDILGFLVTAALVVIWLIGQISGIKKQVQRPAPPKPDPRPPRPDKPVGRPQAGGPPQAGGVPRQGRPDQPAMPDPIAEEIEDFLRRAAQRRNQGQVEEVEVLVPEPVAKQRRPQEAVVVRPAVPVVQQEPETVRTLVSHTKPEPIGSQTGLDTGLGHHVTEPFGTSSFQKRTSALGKDIAVVDNRFETHRHQTFDHTVSHLVHRELEPGEPPNRQVSPFVQTLVKIAQSPESMQQVLVWHEILRRPEERW